MTISWRILVASSALAFFSSTALADVPPPNACNTEGERCDTAGPDYNAPGVCKKTTCSRPTPSGTMEYECHLCQGGAPSTEGTGGATSATGGATSTTGGAPSTSGGTSSTPKSDDASDDGCSYSGAARGSLGGVALVAGGLLWALARRRAHAR